jgi:hypothetical protein
MEIFLNRRKPRQRSIHPDRAPRKTVFVFFVAFCQSRLAKSLRRVSTAEYSPGGRRAWLNNADTVAIQVKSHLKIKIASGQAQI